jgi:hypothetical protein
MRARTLIGKTIKQVHQYPVTSNGGRRHWSLDAIEFTDGTFLRIEVIETDADYGLAPVYPAASIEEKRQRILAQFAPKEPVD